MYIDFADHCTYNHVTLKVYWLESWVRQLNGSRISGLLGTQIDLDHWKLGGVVDGKVRMRVENGLKDQGHMW